MPHTSTSSRLVRTLVALVAALAVAAPAAIAAGPASAAFTAAPASAADPTVPAPTTLTLSATASGKTGLPATFTATLADAAGAPVVGAEVLLQGLATDWADVATGTTDPAGVVTFRVPLPRGETRWRATYAGSGTHAPSTSAESVVTGTFHASRLTLSGPRRLVDERSARLSVRWLADDGTPVDAVVVVQRRVGQRWVEDRRVRTTDGGASFTVAPRTDSAWRVSGGGGPWWSGAVSGVLGIDNVPPIAPVALPRQAPRPARLAAQARASGGGANAVITAIPDSVWRSMVGRSWHNGCPVGRSSLRLLRINYWGFDGYRYRGEMVLNAAVVGKAAGALRAMYDGRYPIRRMYRVDRFGWSDKLQGADDHASMRADNTSGFNCRSVVGRPGVRSPHATGRSVDINPWENPFHSASGIVPNRWWASRSHPKVAWRSASHPVVRIWRAHGFRWSYGSRDSQHVDGRTAPRIAGGFSG